MVSYLEASADIVVKDGVWVRVERTKSEGLLADFRHADSLSSKTVTLVARNPLLTLLVFLQTRTIASADDKTTLLMPLVLDPQYIFTAKKDRGDYKDQHKKLETLLDESRENFFLATQVYQNTFLEEMSNDHKLANLVKYSRSTTLAELKKAILTATDKNPRLREIQQSTQKDLSKHGSNIRVLSRILECSRLAPAFEANCKALDTSYLNLPSDKAQIDTALSKLAGLLHMSIESLCLDCWYEHDQLPFMTSIINTKHVELGSRCLNCGGMGLIHQIVLTLPQFTSKLFLETSNWFYEFLVGHIAAQLAGVKSVYIHKNIQAYSNGGVSEGAEIDVAIVTDDDKLYFVEVTTKSDANEILKDAERKISMFDRLGLPFEKLAFVTAGNTARYLDLDPRLRIFQLRHLTSLSDFLGRWIEDGAKRE